MNKQIIQLRHTLHQNPELSNQESNTSQLICDFITQYKPDEIINLGPTGRAFVFKGKHAGKTVMFRSELDAVPINETSNLPYASKSKGVAHSCGHDGHMAILSALAQQISTHRPVKGKVILLFQQAEECEQGARDVVNHPNFKRIEPDYIFALHNIPGAEKHNILLKEGSFAAASKGMTIKLIGKTSHAAEPDKGLSPASAIAQIIQELHKLRDNKELFSDLSLLTIVNIQLGEIAFGTTPGYAEIRLTLRTIENHDMKLLTQKSEEIVSKIAKEEGLQHEIEYCEIFPATVNNTECCNIIQQAAQKQNQTVKIVNEAFRWSEDFAYFTEKYPGALFGLGAGTQQAALHHSNYDFPDDIIETGAKLFFQIYEDILH